MPFIKNRRGTVWQRFWSKVLITDYTSCWLWTGTINEKGYAYFKPDGKMVRAHKWIWEQFNGPIAGGLELDHKCRIRHCVNPAHLQPVTHLENMRRGFWASRTHCSKGHEFTPKNTRWNGKQRVCRECDNARSRR